MNALLITTIITLSLTQNVPPSVDHNSIMVPANSCKTYGEAFLREEALLIAKALPDGFDIKLSYRCLSGGDKNVENEKPDKGA